MADPDYNAVDICIAVRNAHPNPASHLPDSPVGKLCAIVASYMAAHKTDLPAVIPPPMDAVITTSSAHGDESQAQLEKEAGEMIGQVL